MIKVFLPNNFLPERKYVLHTMLTHYLGIEVEIIPRAEQVAYELSWEGKTIIISDHFFGKSIEGQSYLNGDRMPALMTVAKSPLLADIVIIYGREEIEKQPDRIECGVDLFAGAFFMLTRWEESLGFFEDQHARFPADKALVVRSGFILRPIVDEYVMLLKHWLIELEYPVPEKSNKFSVVPTCDVDMPFFWLRKPKWKVILREWMKDKKISTISRSLKKIKAVEAGQETDPYDQFDYMMTLAEKAGLSITFNMLVGGISQYEGFYSLKDEKIKTLMQSFRDRGHQIGLHPSYNSFVDPKLIIEEKNMLTKALNMAVNTSRQHYLRFSVPATWRHLADAGIREDSTMGYAAEPGFRCGTCRPFPVFDVTRIKQLPLIERPLIVMDVSLRNYKKLSPQASLDLCQTLIDQVKKHDGEFVFLWHNSNLSEVEGWEEWREVFSRLFSLNADSHDDHD